MAHRIETSLAEVPMRLAQVPMRHAQVGDLHQARPGAVSLGHLCNQLTTWSCLVAARGTPNKRRAPPFFNSRVVTGPDLDLPSEPEIRRL